MMMDQRCEGLKRALKCCLLNVSAPAVRCGATCDTDATTFSVSIIGSLCNKSARNKNGSRRIGNAQVHKKRFLLFVIAFFVISLPSINGGWLMDLERYCWLQKYGSYLAPVRAAAFTTRRGG